MTKSLVPKLFLGGFASSIGFVAPMTSGAPIFNVNSAFIANEAGSPTDPNGPYTYGYTFAPTSPGSISTANLLHSGPTGFNGTDPGVQGYFVNNNVIVPAVIGNITNSPIVTNFGVTLKPNELLLHPGGITSDGFAPPYADGDIQYVVPAAGIYTISGFFDALSTGGTGVSVYVNGVQKFNAQDGGQGTATPFLVTQSLLANDTIAFVVDPGNDGGIGSDSTGLFANIQTPEPASLGLLSMGALVLLSRRRQV